MGGDSGSGDGISWQIEAMRLVAGLNEVLAWETPPPSSSSTLPGNAVIGRGEEVHLVLDVFEMTVRLTGQSPSLRVCSKIGILALPLPDCMTLGLSGFGCFICKMGPLGCC